MKINVSILSKSDIELNKIIPTNYLDVVKEDSFYLANPKSSSDWISIEKIRYTDSIVDYSDSELEFIYHNIGDNFFTILVTLKREFAKFIFDAVINKLEVLSDNKIIVVLYTSPLKIFKLENFIPLYKDGLPFE